ncbi:esterase/lipase [Komagataeibacter xylinus E25]|nr:esterase/lipase [Komagataeibacter xylinus E25]
MTSSFQYGANVHANGIRQHYLRYGGKGTSLVLVPGITSPAITWGFVAEELARTHDVYVLDIRGRGLSQGGDDLAYDLDAYAGDVRGFIDALGLKDCVVLGHSMGARIAIRLGRQDASGIAALVLVDPPVSGPGPQALPIQPAMVCRFHPPCAQGHGCRSDAPLLPHMDRRATPAACRMAAYLRGTGHPHHI